MAAAYIQPAIECVKEALRLETESQFGAAAAAYEMAAEILLSGVETEANAECKAFVSSRIEVYLSASARLAASAAAALPATTTARAPARVFATAPRPFAAAAAAPVTEHPVPPAQPAPDTRVATDPQLYCSVFVDLSNLKHGSRNWSGAGKRVDYARAARFFENGRPVRCRHVVFGGEYDMQLGRMSSQTLKTEKAWKQLDYIVDVLPTTNHREHGVDETLHSKMYHELHRAVRPGVLILVTGDGNRREVGCSTFPEICEDAIARGWVVEVYSWSDACNARFRELQAAHPGRMHVYPLDHADIFSDMPAAPTAPWPHATLDRAPAAAPAALVAQAAQARRPGDWSCMQCHDPCQFAWRTCCKMCGAQRPVPASLAPRPPNPRPVPAPARAPQAQAARPAAAPHVRFWAPAAPLRGPPLSVARHA